MYMPPIVLGALNTPMSVTDILHEIRVKMINTKNKVIYFQWHKSTMKELKQGNYKEQVKDVSEIVTFELRR